MFKIYLLENVALNEETLFIFEWPAVPAIYT